MTVQWIWLGCRRPKFKFKMCSFQYDQWKSFGGHLLPQISRWSQVLKTVSILPSSGNGSVSMPKGPPLGLELLWLESALKILSGGHKKTQPYYTHEELLTSTLSEENPFYPIKGSRLQHCSFKVFWSCQGLIHLQGSWLVYFEAD